MRPWGPQVTARDVRTWQARVAGLPPGPDGRTRIAVEQRSRYLEDLLMSYTDVEFADPKGVARWPASYFPVHYFHPMNRGALYATLQWMDGRQVYADRLMEYRVDLLPVDEDAEGSARVGAGRFKPYVVHPREAGLHMQEFAVTAAVDSVVWIDLGNSEAGVPKRLTISDAVSAEPWVQHSIEGNGLQAIFLPGNRVAGTRAVLRLDSEAATPARPVVTAAPAEQVVFFALGDERRLSLGCLFPDEGATPERMLSPLRSDRDRRFRAPLLHSDEPVVWRVAFELGIDRGGSVAVGATFDDGRCVVRDAQSGTNTAPILMRPGEPCRMRLVRPDPASPRIASPLFRVGFAVRKGDDAGIEEPLNP
jgi:hypothetical protein